MSLRLTSRSLLRQAMLSLILVAATATATMAQAQTATAAFTDSTAAGLAGTRRVAITSVIVSFQASVAGTKAGGSGMLADKSSAQTVLAMTDMDPVLQEAIAEQAYAKLKTDLTAAGFEVVSEDEVRANPVYGQILKLAAIPNHSQYGNVLGDAMLVSPDGLTPYLAYAAETGQWQAPKSYIGWTRAGGASITPGGPSMVTTGRIWTLPSLEVQLAKALNAHLVKANYVVTLGEASVTKKRTLGGTHADVVDGRGTASAQVGLLADQTHIAFRAPNGNAKWQKIAMMKVVPAKDGDVVVRLAGSLEGGSDYFDISGYSSHGGLFNPGADLQFKFNATVTDPAAYRKDVDAMIGAASESMTALLKP